MIRRRHADRVLLWLALGFGLVGLALLSFIR